MSLYRPCFDCTSVPDGPGYRIRHNCNGGIGFISEDLVDENISRLIELAIEEGKRRRSLEIAILISGVAP